MWLKYLTFCRCQFLLVHVGIRWRVPWREIMSVRSYASLYLFTPTLICDRYLVLDEIWLLPVKKKKFRHRTEEKKKKSPIIFIFLWLHREEFVCQHHLQYPPGRLVLVSISGGFGMRQFDNDTQLFSFTFDTYHMSYVINWQTLQDNVIRNGFDNWQFCITKLLSTIIMRLVLVQGPFPYLKKKTFGGTC